MRLDGPVAGWGIDWPEHVLRSVQLRIVGLGRHPFVGVSLRPLAEQIYNGGRSILAAAQNPGSQPGLGGSAMGLEVGGTVNPV